MAFEKVKSHPTDVNSNWVERKVDEKKKRKEEPGSFIVQPNCSNKSQLLLDLDKNKELYFSVTVLHP